MPQARRWGFIQALVHINQEYFLKNCNHSRAALLAILSCACFGASAQSSVTVYGVADAYLQIGSGGRGSTKTLQSGGLQGSRVGFRGTEDLGGGLKALFQLESGLALDTGTVTQGGTFWGRQAYVGLSGDFGTTTAGRQYSPLFVAIDTVDPFGTGLGSVYSSGIVTTLGGTRVNNSIIYSSPKVQGFSGKLLAAAGENVTGRSLGADVRYSTEKFVVAMTFTQQDRFAPGTVKGSSTLVSGMYDFGAFKLMGVAQSVKHANLLAVNDDREEFFAGVQVPVATGTIKAVYGGGKVKNVAGTKASEFSLGYDHALSKRTTLYVLGSKIDNGALTAFTTAGATGSGPSTATGHDVKALQIGMRHRF
ncbi:porin [Pelomonas sp. Root1444]|uniref:porin n=1 Tax=Pelomonas sp. Root1444 TaxID=1736464 RepID=UPI000703631D|nr:porin [Pelomonas sp. Root1444]KQY90746.1 hypothetical protein ASD35_02770 [Pelomonas sp. Root1444]